MKKFTFFLDAGHGGMIDGHYQTAPSKMHTFPDGVTVYEGDFNRKVVAEILKQTTAKPYDVIYSNRFYTTDDCHDPKLSERARVINQLFKVYGCHGAVISIHGNAGGGEGGEVFAHPNSKRGEDFAKIFEKHWIAQTGRKWRGVKKANFAMLRDTLPPAFLTENGFFDNRKDADWMTSEEGIKQIAAAHVAAMDEINQFVKII